MRRGGSQKRWHSLASCNHSDSSSSRFRLTRAEQRPQHRGGVADTTPCWVVAGVRHNHQPRRRIEPRRFVARARLVQRTPCAALSISTHSLKTSSGKRSQQDIITAAVDLDTRSKSAHSNRVGCSRLHRELEVSAAAPHHRGNTECLLLAGRGIGACPPPPPGHRHRQATEPRDDSIITAARSMHTLGAWAMEWPLTGAQHGGSSAWLVRPFCCFVFCERACVRACVRVSAAGPCKSSACRR
jgi:hypothetical protein